MKIKRIKEVCAGCSRILNFVGVWRPAEVIRPLCYTISAPHTLEISELKMSLSRDNINPYYLRFICWHKEGITSEIGKEALYFKNILELVFREKLKVKEKSCRLPGRSNKVELVFHAFIFSRCSTSSIGLPADMFLPIRSYHREHRSR